MIQRIADDKDIGVRKVLGASVSQGLSIIYRDFILLVMVALIIAAPLAYTRMHQWFQNFSYHTAISWWMFVLSGLIMTIIAMLYR